MKFEKCYIISWFGPDSTNARRAEIHKRQLDWVKKNDLQPVVFAQNYKEEQYEPDVQYIKHQGKVLTPGDARNILLKEFYNSDEDYAIFADNDTYLYTGQKYGANDTFVQTFRNIPFENLSDVDMFLPVNPANQPFTKDLTENAEGDKIRWRLRPTFMTKTSILIVKNIKKHHDKEIYFDEKFVNSDGTLIPCEDQNFGIEFIQNGLGVFICNNIIFKEEQATPEKSTWSTGMTAEQRWERTASGLKFISEIWNLPKQDTVAKGTWMRMFKQKNPKLKQITVNLTEKAGDIQKSSLESLFL
jgi:hypothetical protein